MKAIALSALLLAFSIASAHAQLATDPFFDMILGHPGTMPGLVPAEFGPGTTVEIRGNRITSTVVRPLLAAPGKTLEETYGIDPIRRCYTPERGDHFCPD